MTYWWYGRLSDTEVGKLQKDYGLAIWQNTIRMSNPAKREVMVTVYTMKNNIIAILHHNVNPDNPTKTHRYCLLGESSWCKWSQDEATGISTYNGINCLPEVFLEVLKPTFMALIYSKLLERCVLGTTQNPNEFINSMV